MTQTTANGLEIEYESFGNPEDPTILLVMGLGGQLTLWREDFIGELVAGGFHVIRYDNRDVGLSTKFEEAGIPDMMALMGAVAQGQTPDAPYSLSDMAADGIGLLDALGIQQAHIVGASMGGMIVQAMAIEHGERIRSMTSIMSTTGNPNLPPGSPDAMGALMGPPVDPNDREAAIERGMLTWRTIGSPGYPASDEELRTQVERDYERCFYPQGTARQMAAIVSGGSRVEALKGISTPTLVIHGADDPLIPPAGGEDTAATIPGAQLHVYDGMGHDFPAALCSDMAARIIDHAKQSDG